MSGHLFAVGAPYANTNEMKDNGLAYLYHLDGTEISILGAASDDYDYFGEIMSISDDTLMVGTRVMEYFKVFTGDGLHTVECGSDCDGGNYFFGAAVETMVTSS